MFIIYIEVICMGDIRFITVGTVAAKIIAMNAICCFLFASLTSSFFVGISLRYDSFSSYYIYASNWNY